jgi:hypothetical protein
MLWAGVRNKRFDRGFPPRDVNFITIINKERKFIAFQLAPFICQRDSQGVFPFTVEKDFIMKMWAGGGAGRAYVTNNISLTDCFASFQAF